jgi:cyclase
MAATGLSLTQIWPTVDWGDVHVRLPTVLVPDSVWIKNGPVTTEVRHLGVSHTTNDLIAWLPKERVLFAGDQVLSGCTPFLLFGSVLGARAAVAQMLRLEPRTVVPGHGPVGGAELIAATLRYLDWVIEAAREGVRSRRTPRALAPLVGPGPFPAWIDGERHVANFHRAYLDLEGASPGEPLDLESVFKDVIDCCEHGYPICQA